jgi:hypothetical protein
VCKLAFRTSFGIVAEVNKIHDFFSQKNF